MLTVEWKFELYTPREETTNVLSLSYFFLFAEMERRFYRVLYFCFRVAFLNFSALVCFGCSAITDFQSSCFGVPRMDVEICSMLRILVASDWPCELYLI